MNATIPDDWICISEEQMQSLIHCCQYKKVGYCGVIFYAHRHNGEYFAAEKENAHRTTYYADPKSADKTNAARLTENRVS